MPEKKKNINITVTLDSENIPKNIKWSADDLKETENAEARAMMISFWDHNQKDTLKLDLWTRKMTVDEMKIFFHQTLLSMADSLENAIGDERISGDMRDFCAYFADKMEIAE